MSWFDTILDVTTTIGRVAGALSGASADTGSDDNMFHMGPLTDGEHVNLCQLIFLRKNGRICAFNQSSSQHAALFFPGNDDVSEMQLFIPPTKAVDVSQAFVAYTNAGVDEFSMLSLPTAGDSTTTPMHAKSGQPMQPGVEVHISPYITVKPNGGTVTIGVVKGLTLAGIVLLTVRGTTSTTLRVINVVRKTGDDDQHITVDLPIGIDIDKRLTWIDVTASVVGLQTVVDEWVRDNAALVGELSENDQARVKAFAARQG